jgi:uncharacterized protein YlzI (FlbEa/FlbD family)
MKKSLNPGKIKKLLLFPLPGIKILTGKKYAV